MNLTPEEIEKLTDIIAEKVMIRLPEAIGNLIHTFTWMAKVNQNFYKDNVDLVKHKDVVMQVMEEVEAAKLGQSYEEIVNKALPIIKERIKIGDKLSMSSVNNISRKINHGDI